MTVLKLEPKLTTANKKLITGDWAARFPGFTVYSQMWLLRRAGPLVFGIVLDRDSGNDKYRPTFHIHCLARPFPTISLMLCQRLTSVRSGSEESIKVRFHYDHVDEAAERLKSQVKFPMFGPIHIDDVISAYYHYMATPSGKLYPVLMYEDMFLYYAWCGQQEKAISTLDGYMPTVKSWEPTIMERDGGPDAWYRKCRQMIDNPAIHQIVEDEVIKHKLQKIADEGLDCRE